MTLVIKSVRKVVVVGWQHTGTSDWNIQGSHASISATGHDGIEREVRNTENDGEANLYFPADYTGDVDITIKGSKSGEDSSTLHIA